MVDVECIKTYTKCVNMHKATLPDYKKELKKTNEKIWLCLPCERIQKKTIKDHLYLYHHENMTNKSADFAVNDVI